MQTTTHTTVIDAGIAGLTCAQALVISGDSLARFVLNPLARHDDLHAEDPPDAHP